MLKRRLHGKTFWVLIVLLMSLCVSALARSSTDEWTLNPADYRYDMSLYLSLASKDYENLDLYEIGAFVNDECRGVAEKLDLPNGGSCLYMRVRSNVSSGETITFKLRDREAGSTYELKGDDGTPLVFQADQMVGKPSDPYVLRIYFNVAVSTDGHGSVNFENGTYADGSILSLNAMPYEGYHFDKWSDGDTALPRQLTVNGDIELTALFAPNIYNAVFMIGSEVIATLEVPYGEAVPSPEVPEKEGAIFAGWNDIPVTMPAHDIEVHGDYITNSYNAIFSIDGEIIAALNIPYGAEIVPPAVPEKTGYSFGGWDNLPETMPAGNIEVTGHYEVNSYGLTFSIGEEKIQESLVEYGATIVAPEAPAKEGYIFTGWQNLPETMPAYDLHIYGEYTPVTYNAVFIIDGEVISTVQVQAGMPITAPEAPVKEGHTFSGWQNLPETMPAQDIEVTGSYEINTYIATFKIGSEVVAEIPVVYNTAVTAPEAPEKEGYTFTGWQNIPETMPPFDITIEGNYAVNSYNAVFMIDGEVVTTISFEYGAAVAAPEAPAKEGHAFAGWQDVPETMPARDITVNGSYTILSYIARFIIDGNVMKEQTVEYGAAVTAPDAPEKEGYTFTGWQNLPETMPASDIDITGAYKVMAYNVIFKIDDEVVAYVPVDFGAAVPMAEAPVKEGYTFNGWENVPETMPAHDVEVTGSYSINTYKAVFKADGEVVATLDVEYNSPLTAPEAPAKEGYTFTGWQNVPETMPPFDVEILGTYAVNTYTATFKIDDEVVAVLSIEYGAVIVAPGAPAKEGLLFDGWSNLPETMPAHDIEIIGTYSEDPNATPVVSTYTATFKIDGEIIAMLPVEEGAAIPAQEAPAKEGHTFAGWQNLPEVMPSHDIEITGSYTVNVYKATFVIDGETIETKDVEYNTAVNAPEAPEKEGYTFTGWQNVPETMPPFDIEIQGGYTVKAYTATFRIGDDIVAAAQFDYGAAVVVPAAPEKEGHTFAGWENVPETMPAADIEITGSYTVNVYKATFVIDGELLVEKDVEYDTVIEAPEAPEKEGYTFSGWLDMPQTMPPYDVVISGTFAANTYTVTFMIGDEVIATVPSVFGTEITAPEAPAKEGHTFAGWQNMPETTPAEDVIVTGSYTVNTYKATFIADDVVVAETDVEYNTAVPVPEAPEKEGYTFTGWQNVPETMPPFDVSILGTYAVNTYNVTFTVDGEIVAVLPCDFGAAITAPEAPAKEGHTFAGWNDVPETMPASDIVITGSYTVNSYVVRYIIDGEVIGEATVEYGAQIPPRAVPEIAGMSFAGWDNVPETMPAYDIDVYGSYVKNTYTATFMIGDELIAALRVSYGDAIQEPEAPVKEGHEFAGWQNVPETMPAEDIVINGSYNVCSYMLTVYLNDDLYISELVEYGAPVVIPEPELSDEYEFAGWLEEIPETMPAHEVVIHGVVNKKSSALEELYKDSETITVYNLNGVLLFDQISVSDALKRLAPGFYIVNRTKVRVK